MEPTVAFYVNIQDRAIYILHGWIYSWLPITQAIVNSNIALTRTKIDFPWISVTHLL